MAEKEILAALWQIAQEVATKDTTACDLARECQYCLFCVGDEYPFKHEASCIVLKARALVAQKVQDE